MSDMERRRAPLATLEISSLEDDAETPLTRELATAASKASSGGMRLLQKPQQAAALELFSTARRSGGRVFLGLSSVWILLGLCWIRWPLYYRELVPALERRLGDKMEVEPVVVSCALVAPFLVAGGVFYWKQDAIGTLEGWGHNLRALRWLKAHPNIGKRLGFDAVDVLLVSGFLLLQVNLVVGKLLIDRESGKLAKAGLLSRTARAFGMNGLYALVLSLLLVARRSFLHKLFGLSGERAARYHVLTGQFGAVMLVLHGVLYVLVWYMQGKVSEMLVPCLEETCTPKQQYGSSRNFFGLVAMVPLIVIVLSSLEWVRRSYFRRFIALHCLSVVFVAFTALHYYPTTFWLIPAFVLYAIYRAVSVFGRGQASVISASALSGKLFQLELRRSTSGGSDFAPGQYVYIKVDAIGKSEWHPFTISSSPLRNRHSFVLDAKVQGHFTSQLLFLMKTQQLHTVQVDGYYGSKIKFAPHMIFVAGGSGMTPFLSVLDHLRALVDTGDRGDMSMLDAQELPQTLWIVWTCRDMELLEAHAELLDTVHRCSRWKCSVWLHLTHAGRGADIYGDDDDDDETEPDDSSDDASPRVQRFYPTSLQRHAFVGHNDMLGLTLFVGTVLGCALLMFWMYHLEGFTSRSFVRRSLLLGAGVVGSVLGASLVLFLVQRLRVSKRDGREGTLGVALGEMEVAGLDVSSPAPPATPRAYPTPAQSLLSRSFMIEKERPDLGVRLRDVHSEIRENYGTKAKVALLVSGPAELQADVLLHARDLQAPTFQMHQKSFLL